MVTINLVDVALSSKKDFNKFWELMEERSKLVHRALQCRHERLSLATSDIAPVLWQYGALARLPKGESIHSLLHNGYSTISYGYAGLYECVKYMTDESHTSGKGKEFGLEVMQFIKDKCDKWKKEENIDYSPYGSPIEATTYKFATCLKKRFGVIEGITDKNYITNSYHVNVCEKIDPFEKLKLEAEFQKLSPGGMISYIETSNLTNNTEAVFEIIKFIYDNIMYAELNTKSDYCQVCGFDGEIQIYEDENGRLDWKCPNCGNTDHNKMNVARRTCGEPLLPHTKAIEIQGKSEPNKDNPEPSFSIKKDNFYYCDICGRKMFRKIKSHGRIFCNKHYKQFKKYGKCLDNNPRTISDRNEYHINGDITYIDLYNKECEVIAQAIIDTEDLQKVKYVKWKLSNSGYVMNTPKTGSNLHMSRIILGVNTFVDHINHNTLDNRKKNLRIITKSQNQMNSNRKGVYLQKNGKFLAQIKINQKIIYLGVYVFEEEAYWARWYAETLIFKEYQYKWKEEPFILEDRKKQIKIYVEKKVQRL